MRTKKTHSDVEYWCLCVTCIVGEYYDSSSGDSGLDLLWLSYNTVHLASVCTAEFLIVTAKILVLFV